MAETVHVAAPASPAAPVIEIKGLTKKYGEQTAVDHLTLNIQKGEIFGLLGPNGAGKSTTILMMLGLSEPTSGEVRVLGINSTRQPMEAKKKVGYLPDDIGFYEDMTGFDNLMYTARLNRLTDAVARERTGALLEKVGLKEAARKKVGAYSRGMRQRLGLADVLIKNPEIIVLDEPTLGIDPEGVRELLQLIRSLSRDEQITVLLSSHHLHQVQQICDRVGLFVNGKMLAVGDIETLAKKLFLEEIITLEVGVEPNSGELVEKLQGMPEVKRVEQTDGYLQIGCYKDISKELPKIIFESGCSLYHLNKKQFGLDEIYHRYFEGGDTVGTARHK